jgi:LPXTG-site transpeptidase (sortase) family protein
MNVKKNKKAHINNDSPLKGIFLIFAIFVAFYSFLSFYGFVPQQVRNINSVVLGNFLSAIDSYKQEDKSQIIGEENENSLEAEFVSMFIEPEHISITKIGVDSAIVIPSSRETEVLDEALRIGVVKYPGSGFLGERSNMLLFGHSTGLPVVQNQAYRVFNGLDKLKQGDDIRVRGGGVEYVYRVSSVNILHESEALIEFNTGSRMLTLSTCNTFGAKEERVVVEATFFTSYPVEI